MNRFPGIPSEEIELLWTYLHEHHGANLNDLCNCCNISYIKDTDVTTNTLMYYCLNFMFVHAMTDNKFIDKVVALDSYPDWVQELYYRASAVEVEGADILDGPIADIAEFA